MSLYGKSAQPVRIFYGQQLYQNRTIELHYSFHSLLICIQLIVRHFVCCRLGIRWRTCTAGKKQSA